MRLSWIRELPEDGKLRAQWEALVLESEQPEVFLTWEWAAAVTRAYGSSLQPWIGTAYEGEELVGMAALAKSSPSDVVFLAGATADYCDFVSRPADRQEFVAQVLSELKASGMRSVVLANLPADSATMAAVKADRSFRCFARHGYECAQVRLGSEEERRVLAQSFLKKKSVRWKMNSLQRIGPIVLRHEPELKPGDSALNTFFSMHVARFLATGRISNLVRPERRRFLAELAQLLGERGWFDLMSLCAGDRVVGYNYGFRFLGSWFHYQPTFENEFEPFSPGLFLLAKMIEAASQDPGAKIVDLGLGAEGYKEPFANAQRTTLHVTLSSNAFDHWRARGRYRAAAAVKRRPKLESLARQAQRQIAHGRESVRGNAWRPLLASAAKRLRRFFASRDEVWLYQWSDGMTDAGTGRRLLPLSWETLAAAAMKYSDDAETLEYLLRSAKRFRAQQYRGYALPGQDGVAKHFAWVAPYDGFAIGELGETLQAHSPERVMIFDCWTPRALRGRGLCGQALQQLASCLIAESKDVWIFGPASDPVSLGGIERVGFCRRFSLVRRKILFWGRTQEQRQRYDSRNPETPSREAVR